MRSRIWTASHPVQNAYAGESVSLPLCMRGELHPLYARRALHAICACEESCTLLVGVPLCARHARWRELRCVKRRSSNGDVRVRIDDLAWSPLVVSLLSRSLSEALRRVFAEFESGGPPVLNVPRSCRSPCWDFCVNAGTSFSQTRALVHASVLTSKGEIDEDKL